MRNTLEQQETLVLRHFRDHLKLLVEMEPQFPELEKARKTMQHAVGEFEQLLEGYEVLKQDWEWFFNNSLDMKFTIGMDGCFSRVNPAVIHLLGFSEQELTSQPFMNFVHPDDIDRTKREVLKLKNGENTQQFENRYRDKHGNWHWLSWTCTPYIDESRQVYAIARDVTASKLSEQQLHYQATHDPLTGLRNRLSLEQELSDAISRCEDNPRRKLAVVAIDLNDFKYINDNYGHAAGDHVLQKIAARFQRIKRKGDLIFRIGGDEFVWLAETSNDSNTPSFIQRVEDALSKPISYQESELNISGSIGVANYPNHAITPESLLSQADKAMYNTKKNIDSSRN